MKTKTHRRRAPPLASLPLSIWLGIFLVAPLCIVVLYSLYTRGTHGELLPLWTFDQYFRAADWTYLQIVFHSLQLALSTTFLCLILGYPTAYVMATAGRNWRWVLMLLILVPFLTNCIVRVYSIRVTFGDFGPINLLLMNLGLTSEPLNLGENWFVLMLGMITNYLPFMVLPIYVSLEKFDFRLLEAARDLGARWYHALFRILLPSTRVGMISGSLFVFTPALGEFLIPDLLTGAKTMLIGNLLTEQFLKTRNWPFGSALSIILMAAVLASLMILIRVEQEQKQKLSQASREKTRMAA